MLRRLAECVAAIAATPADGGNSPPLDENQPAGKNRPPVFCDPENGWNEIITEAQMQCRGKLARRWEMDLRKEIFWGEVMGDDKPVEPYFDVPYTAAADDWGLQAVYHKPTAGAPTSGKRHQGLCRRLEKDALSASSNRLGNHPGCVEIAQDVLGDLLPVRLRGVSSEAASWPLRTAPSMVAGHPVSHQAPARNRPGTSVVVAGRNAREPGMARNVAAFSRVTTASRSRAWRAAGSSSRSASKNRLTSSGEPVAMWSSAAESEMARHWPERAPLETVRSKTNWTGESTQAMSGRSVTFRSRTKWTLTMGEAPRRSASRACR